MRRGLFTSFSIIRFSIFCSCSLGFLLPLSVNAHDFKSCDSCHAPDLAEDYGRIYLHPPFALEECGKCHAAEIPADQKPKDKSAGQLDRRKIDWLADTSMVYTSHVFLLPGGKVRDNLVIEMREPDGKFSRREITVPILNDLAEVADSGQPSTISDVRVLKVERGVFLSVTIGWQTDTLSYAQVRYGNRDLSLTSEPGKRLGLRHEVVLFNLKPDQTYRYSVVSTDLFGRTEASEPREFSTSDPYVAPSTVATSGNPPGMGTDEVFAGNFKRFGADYLLELNLAQPAAVYVGSNGKARQKILPALSAIAATGKENASHKGLSGQAINSMKACRNCHSKQSTATHPVNVFPKPGMTIPPEYPTLPDGRITCGSCHISHSSNYEYLARKRGKRELCVGCHKDML